MKQINAQYMNVIKSRWNENITSGKAQVDYMEQSTAVYKGIPVACLYAPKIYDAEGLSVIESIAETIAAILEKVIAQYLLDPAYRELFDFDPRLEALILSEAGYEQKLPISRLDIFLNEDDYTFKFCEFNADGSSGMNEDREINIAIADSDAMVQMKQHYNFETFELFHSWVTQFMNIFNHSRNAAENPLIVITDFMEGATSNEFIQFKEAFQNAGLRCEIHEIRTLRYENGALKTPDGDVIHAVYRRAVTSDIMLHYDEVQAFINAVTDGAVCCAGHFRTQVIHNKSIFKILHQAETLAFLTPHECDFVRAHIPKTYAMNAGMFDYTDVVNHRAHWIIKPEDGYGSGGVYAGMDFDDEGWRALIRKYINKGYIVQEYCDVYQSENVDFNYLSDPHDAKPGMYNNITGMFVYCGKLAGIYSRAGQQGTISSYTDGKTLASIKAAQR